MWHGSHDAYHSRALAFLAFLLFVVDVVGGLTPVWSEEVVRVWTARWRLPVDAATLIAWADAHSNSTRRMLSKSFLCVACPTALALATVAGAVGATVRQLGCRGHDCKEWIFAVESSGVLLLLLLAARCWSRREEPLVSSGDHA